MARDKTVTCSVVLPPVEPLVAYRPIGGMQAIKNKTGICHKCRHAMLNSECEMVRCTASLGHGSAIGPDAFSFTAAEAYQTLHRSHVCTSKLLEWQLLVVFGLWKRD